jgi:hypothetical protein
VGLQRAGLGNRFMRQMVRPVYPFPAILTEYSLSLAASTRSGANCKFSVYRDSTAILTAREPPPATPNGWTVYNTFFSVQGDFELKIMIDDETDTIDRTIYLDYVLLVSNQCFGTASPTTLFPTEYPTEDPKVNSKQGWSKNHVIFHFRTDFIVNHAKHIIILIDYTLFVKIGSLKFNFPRCSGLTTGVKVAIAFCSIFGGVFVIFGCWQILPERCKRSNKICASRLKATLCCHNPQQQTDEPSVDPELSKYSFLSESNDSAAS